MFYTYILRSLSQPEQRYIGSTADLQASLAIRRFFLLAKTSEVKRSERRMPGILSSVASAEEEALLRRRAERLSISSAHMLFVSQSCYP